MRQKGSGRWQSRVPKSIRKQVRSIVRGIYQIHYLKIYSEKGRMKFYGVKPETYFSENSWKEVKAKVIQTLLKVPHVKTAEFSNSEVRLSRRYGFDSLSLVVKFDYLPEDKQKTGSGMFPQDLNMMRK